MRIKYVVVFVLLFVVLMMTSACVGVGDMNDTPSDDNEAEESSNEGSEGVGK